MQAVGLINWNSKSCYINAVLRALARAQLVLIAPGRMHSQRCGLVHGPSEHQCLACAVETILKQISFPNPGQAFVNPEWFVTQVRAPNADTSALED